MPPTTTTATSPAPNAEVERLRVVVDAARYVASGDVPMLHLLSALDDYPTPELPAEEPDHA